MSPHNQPGFTNKSIRLSLTLIVLFTSLGVMLSPVAPGESDTPVLAGNSHVGGSAGGPLKTRRDSRILAPVAPQVAPQPPDAVDDLYATPQNTVLDVPSWQGVLENDTSPSASVLTATLGTPPASGTLTLTVDGGFVYQPPPGYSGLITFTYAAHATFVVGSGVFTSGWMSNTIPPWSRDVALGDLDGDGDSDAIVAAETHGIYFNRGGAQGETPGTFSDGGQDLGSGHGVALGDVDGDGDLDAVFAAHLAWSTVYINQGGDQGGAPGVFSDSGQTLGDGYGVALGDIDGDGDLDAVIADTGPNTVYTNTNQSGIFSDTAQSLGDSWSNAVALGDLDGDGDLDAVFANDGADKVYINEGGDQGGAPGEFSVSDQNLGDSWSSAVALGDVDGDGYLDAVFANSGGSTVWRNDGAGAFITGTVQTLTAGTDVALGDLNDDGHLDIWLEDQTGSDTTVWLNDGYGNFADSGQALLGLGISALGDLDGDRDLDAFSVRTFSDSGGPMLVWLNQNTTRALSDTATVRILVGDVQGPVDITLDHDTVAENQPAGTLVGTFGTVDPSSDTHSYTLVPGPGGDHNDAFTIAGDQLRTEDVFDYEDEQSTIRSVRVRTDNGELTFEKTLLVHIADVEPEPEGPPTYCDGYDISLFDTQDASATLTNVTVTNYDPSTGCDVEGELNLRLPGNALTGISFQGYVNEWNKLYSEYIAPFDLEVTGMPLHADQVRLASYAGKLSVRLGTAEICAPVEWGGQCASATHANLRFDGSGLFVGSGGELPLPEMSIQQNATHASHVTGPAVLDVYTLLDLDFFAAELTPVRQDPHDAYSRIIGYEIKASASLDLPKISGKKGSDGRDCSLAVYVTLYQSVSGVLTMTIETAPAGVTAPGGLEFREGHLGLSCDPGIPIDATGLQVSGVFGTISLRPDAQWVEIGLEITNADSSLNPADLQLLKIEAIVKILWQPEWGVDLTGRLTLLEFYEAAEATASIREDSLRFTLYIQAFIVRGELVVNAWWPDGSFHFSGSGRVTVGLWKGSIWEWCFWALFGDICISIPPFDLTLPPVGADFGEFTNGKYGVKGYIEVFGKQYGFYIDEDGDLDIGGVSEYQIVTPPQFALAHQRWKAAQQQAERDGLWLDPEGWDETFSFPAENIAAINVTVSPSDVITRMQVITPTDVSFLVSTQVPVTVSLRTPSDLVITPDNYNVPPISPTHNVYYTVTDQITYTQYWYDVRPAEIGEWQVIVEGDLDQANPLVGVIGFANIPTLEDVTVADTSDPSQVPVNWSLTSDVPATVTVYANRGDITSTVTVTDTNGMTTTEVISNYHGVPVGVFPATGLYQLLGARASGTVDLTTLESDDYALWVALEDGINPAINTYARRPGTEDVAIVTVDNTATFPSSWSPVVTPTVLPATRQLLVEWEALTHPDVDDYTIYIGLAPHAPDIALSGLSAAVKRDEQGRPIGSATVWHNIADVKPGETYYLSFQANDAESFQSVRTSEISVTISAGDFQLTTASSRYGVAQGARVTIPLSLDIRAPLFYPQVYIEVDDAELPRGIAVLFENDAIGETNLSAESQTVNAIVSVDAYVPDGIYTLSLAGYSGELERRADVEIHVPAIHLYLPLILENHVPAAPDLVVDSITASSDAVQVVVKNQGNAPVVDPFWVDAYIDPDPVPNAVNQIWNDLSDQGLVWGVTADALPALKPGGTLTLTVQRQGEDTLGDSYFWAEFSQIHWPLAAGTPVYAQVDSANAETVYGGVLEYHEIIGSVYNNVGGPVQVTSGGAEGTSGTGPSPGGVGDPDGRLPRRP